MSVAWACSVARKTPILRLAMWVMDSAPDKGEGALRAPSLPPTCLDRPWWLFVFSPRTSRLRGRRFIFVLVLGKLSLQFRTPLGHLCPKLVGIDLRLLGLRKHLALFLLNVMVDLLAE